jgi:large subunit ribosomal protein L25
MANTNLKARPRDGRGKGAARKLRAAGEVPAVIYGRGESTRQLAVDAHELERLFARVHYENTILTLNIEGDAGEVRALVREVQKHAFRSDVLHVDFQQIHAGDRVTVAVPLRLVGAPPGVRAGGILQHSLTDLEVECLADSIPDHIDVDVSALDIGDTVHVSDLTLPAGINVVGDGDRSVCTLAPPIVAPAEEAEEAEVEGVEPEVIGRAGAESDADENE